MPDYSVSFKIHLIPFLKPEGWPNPVLHDCFFRVDNFETLKKLTNKEALTFIQQNGVVIMKESKEPLDDNIETMDARIFVPLHNISHITTETKKLVTDVPDLEEEGVQLQ